MKYELPENLKDALNELFILYDEAYIELRKEVIYLIRNNIRNINIIEHTFDKLLNIPTEKCYKLFTLLCEYVSTFDTELVDDYKEIYNELYGEEESKSKKK